MSECVFCDEELDEDDTYTHVVACKFKKVSHGQVELYEIREAEACEGCHDSNTFYCQITDYNYYDGNFGSVDDEDGESVCAEAAEAAGYIRTENENWVLPAEPTNKENSVSDTKYSDFYWYLKDGERRGMLQLDGGGEEAMPRSLEKKIHHRIQEAGGDGGDPHVVNVYTRLELIDQGILPKDYML